MYIPKSFEASNQEEIFEFLSAHSLGTFILSQPELQACHLPFIVNQHNGSFVLETHLAKANKQSQFTENENALVVFTGPNGYVSSSVYENVNAPTYNYQAVHISGIATKLTNDELLNHLTELVAKNETGRVKQFHINQMPAAMLSDYLNEIVGVRIVSTKIEVAFKLSQNRNQKDFNAIIDDLDANPANEALISAMKKTR
ncbi:MAG: FMN-binding negative transcriptional regulator [Bacteroidota bacterium]